MAKFQTAETVRNRNSRLEAFLKRSMDLDSYERIRTHDSCIVCSEKEDKAFKFVIISDQVIYLTENPPKKLTEVIHFRDVVSITMESDFAAFLSGDEQQNAQHILITYRTEDKKSAKFKERAKDAETPSVRTPRSARSNALSVTAKLGYTPRSARSVGLLSTRDSSRHVTFDSSCADGTETAENNNNEKDENLKNGKKFVIKKSRQKRVKESGKNSVKLSTSMDEGMLRDVLKKSGGKKKVKQEILDESNNSIDIPEVIDTGKKRLPFIPPLDLDDDELGESLSPRSILKNSMTRTDDDDDDDDVKNDDGLKEEKFHLYILSGNSKMYFFIRCAWNNFIIRGTLEEDLEYLQRKQLYPPRDGQGARERLENLYTQLKNELLDPSNSLEEVFVKLRELKLGMERNFAIKRFFWKTSEVYLYLVDELNKYIPQRKEEYSSTDISSRADELELVLLILDLMAGMLRETEIYPSRIEYLKVKEGEVLARLLGLLVYEQPPYLATVDHEMYELTEELTVCSATVLFELILVAVQSNNQEKNRSFFSLPWIIEIIEKSDSLEGFISRVVTRALDAISPTHMEELRGDEAVNLYHQFFILDTLTNSSEDILEFIQDKFYEEFKYYVHPVVVKRKLPKRYLIRPYIMKAIENVTDRILHGQQTTSRKKRTPPTDKSGK